ncbi:MAG TPA: DUF1573 domain-containing protein [Bacteroidales bacterium]|nr:DUF1573 domain-containing protein [Bacteroidales bacterium]HOH22425.1 DUF1573 domain-containing protein [Bacteroidales bacterium]HPB56912.1 DUF1573 domain-containing protein [Bacteroidales bacterium]HPZ03584.1 DUF1573 domain-containing protein [Bacteroidales bacterium]HQB74958.1 DUF1573 domain-containing protein [Bacteroidales bacterium]
MMQKFLIFIVLLLLIAGCGRKSSTEIGVESINNPATAEGIDPARAERMPVITFEKIVHDFGYVTKGERLSYNFKFKNTGNSDLIISYVESSCGCTTSSPPKAPIKPGGSGEIKVTFDSKTKSGITENQVMIVANTYPVKTVLTVIADVKNP